MAVSASSSLLGEGSAPALPCRFKDYLVVAVNTGRIHYPFLSEQTDLFATVLLAHLISRSVSNFKNRASL